MAGIVAGDFKDVKVTSPTLGSRTLYFVSDTDGTVDMGGYRADDGANNIDGGGRPINKWKQTRWMVKGTVSWNMEDPNGDELSFAVACAQDPNQLNCTFTHVNGSVWVGTGVFTGDLQGSTKDGQFDITLSGGGILQKTA